MDNTILVDIGINFITGPCHYNHAHFSSGYIVVLLAPEHFQNKESRSEGYAVVHGKVSDGESKHS